MPRNVFDEELARLNADLAEMGRRIDSIMQGTIRTLKNMDVAMAKSIFQKDVEINTMEKSIEQSCMNLLALQQPLARDLRVITATLKVITDMERISDQCADICEILGNIGHEYLPADDSDVREGPGNGRRGGGCLYPPRQWGGRGHLRSGR